MANYKVSRVYNPLFIYGASGLGKTHLMQAIAHEILEKRDDCYVMYLSSEKFTNEMISAVRNNTNCLLYTSDRIFFFVFLVCYY